jgi:uncharacterized RDD family membrane protein YckC
MPGVQFAPHGERLIAYIIDAIVVTVVTMVLLVLAALAWAVIGNGAGITVFFFGLLAVIVVSLAYFPWFWARGGQTPGMRPFDLRVVRDSDGGPLSGGQAIVRLIGLWVNAIVFYLGYIWIFIDARRRGWHDLIAGTVVIKG